LAAWNAEGRRGRVSLARGARGKRVGRKLGAREWFGSWCGAWPARGRGAVPDVRRRTDAVTAKKQRRERNGDGGDGSLVIRSKFKIFFCKLNFSPFSWPQMKNF
jgi:hypothetical protein